MGHYIDIHLRPDPEFPAHQLMGALYAKLHRILAQAQSSQIGVSFPGYRQAPASLGDKLRLIGPQGDLVRLMEHDWLRGMRDHTHVMPIAAVPAEAVQRSLRRVQVKSSPERMRRRLIRRQGLTEADAIQRIPDSAAERLNLPYLQLTSGSTGQTFRIYFRMGPTETEKTAGEFNAYGLSGAATIPWF